MKKIISMLLVAVMFLSFFSLTAAAKTADVETAVKTYSSEKECFDYLADYISKYGEYKDEVYTCYLISTLSSSFICKIIYNPKTVRIIYSLSPDFSELNSHAEELGLLEEPQEFLEISFGRNSEKWDFLLYLSVKTKNEIAYVNASTSFEPKTFDPWFIEFDVDSYFYPEELYDVFTLNGEDLCENLEDFEIILESYFGINLGNFGFEGITPAKLPDKIVEFADFEMNYKETAKFDGLSLINLAREYDDLEFKSSDKSVVVVDEYGNIRAVGKGTAKIACRLVDKEGHTTYKSYTVTVKFTFWQWLIQILLLGFLWY